MYGYVAFALKPNVSKQRQKSFSLHCNTLFANSINRVVIGSWPVGLGWGEPEAEGVGKGY
jgi:hypothetical protein